MADSSKNGKVFPTIDISGRLDSMIVLRKCSECGERLPLENFPKNGKNRNGSQRYRPECNECRKAAKRSERWANRDYYNNKSKQRYRANPWKRKLHAIYQSRRDYPGRLTIDDLKQVWRDSEGTCSYCDVALKFHDVESWTFDHKRPLSQGGEHTRDNLQVCCSRCNRKKGIKSDAEFRMQEYGVPF